GAYAEILEVVQATTKASAVAGCSGSGVLTEDREVEKGPALALALAAGEGLEIEAGLLPEVKPHEVGKAVGLLARAGTRKRAAEIAAAAGRAGETAVPVPEPAPRRRSRKAPAPPPLAGPPKEGED